MAQILPGTPNDRIGDIRTKRELTKKELSAMTGIAASQLTRIETGAIKTISSDILIKLAKALNVSTDFILGLTPIESPKNYEIDQFGLSEAAVKNLLVIKGNMPILNRILAHRSFPSLITQVKSYFYDETAMGVMGRNALFDMAIGMMDAHRKENPADSAGILGDMRFVNTEKVGKHEIDIEKIKNIFMAILRDIKKEIDAEGAQGDAATSELLQKILSEMANLPSDKRTPKDVVDVISQAVAMVAPVDDANMESFRQLALSMFENLGAEGATDTDEVPAHDIAEDE